MYVYKWDIIQLRDRSDSRGLFPRYTIQCGGWGEMDHMGFRPVVCIASATWSGAGLMQHRVGYDDAQALRQKRDFANSLCLGGTFAWALDLGGPGTMSDLANMDPNAGMEGADPDGDDSGSGNVLIGHEIYSEEQPTISCIPPCNFIFPPLALSTPTTISFEAYTTSLEVVWPTTTVVTLPNGALSTSTGYSRTIHTTTLQFPPITTTAIPAWNWNITEGLPKDPVYRLSSSLLPPPYRITNPVNPELTTPGVPPTPVIRSVTPPPYPWSTNSDDRNPFPTVSFTSAPPGPLCTSGCGRRCNLFCSGPCSHDCIDGGDDFYDPQDPDPPGRSGCRGPDCDNGECTGELCMYVGCDGGDCDSNSGICTGNDCRPVGCSGSDCGSDGHCSGSDCITAGCTGSGCNGGSGFCFGLHCFSFGCLGIGCGSNHRCTGRDCDIVTCSGRNCHYGVCTGKGCKPGGPEDGCDSGETAQHCTVMVAESRFAAGDAISTTTVTKSVCTTITACGAEPTTTTSTIDNAHRTITPSEWLFHPVRTGQAVWNQVADRIEASLGSWHPDDYGTATRPTTTTKPPPTTTTTSRYPPATSAAGCTLYNNQLGVCWSPCDPYTQTPIEAPWKKGDPWCYLVNTDTNIGALCDEDSDCPKNFACQDWTFPQGGCRAPENEQTFPGGCDLMNNLQGVCWQKCDPQTGDLVNEPWYEGDPWCWLYDGEVGLFCDTSEDQKCYLNQEFVACQPDDWTHGGCAVDTPTFLTLFGPGDSSLINSLSGSSAVPGNGSLASLYNSSASSSSLRV